MSDDTTTRESEPQAKKRGPLFHVVKLFVLPWVLLIQGLKGLYRRTYNRTDAQDADVGNGFRTFLSIVAMLVTGICRANTFLPAELDWMQWLTCGLVGVGSAIATFYVIVPAFYLGFCRFADVLWDLVDRVVVKQSDGSKKYDHEKSSLTQLIVFLNGTLGVIGSLYLAYLAGNWVYDFGHNGFSGFFGVVAAIFVVSIVTRPLVSITTGMSLALPAIALGALGCYQLTPQIQQISKGAPDILAGLYIVTFTTFAGIAFPIAHLLLNKVLRRLIDKLEEIRKDVYSDNETKFKQLVLHLSNFALAYGVGVGATALTNHYGYGSVPYLSAVVQSVATFASYLLAGRALTKGKVNFLGYRANGMTVLGLLSGLYAGIVTGMMALPSTAMTLAVAAGLAAFAVTSLWVFPLAYAVVAVVLGALLPHLVGALSALLSNVHERIWNSFKNIGETIRAAYISVRDDLKAAIDAVLKEIKEAIDQIKKDLDRSSNEDNNNKPQP